MIEPADHLEVLARAEQIVDGRGLTGEPDARTYGCGLGDDVVAADPRAAAGRRR
jgi:hypothetical protein